MTLKNKVNVVTLTVCSGDATGEQLCDILEAVFLHELKNKVSTFLPLPISSILLSLPLSLIRFVKLRGTELTNSTCTCYTLYSETFTTCSWLQCAY